MASKIEFTDVHDVLGKYMLADGMELVWDAEKSHGNWIVDGKSGKEYLDLFSFFATNPIGHNHPKMLTDKVKNDILRTALINPSNSDIYTVDMAKFVETFWNTTIPEGYKYIFFVAGGALAVENALKAAFDWKVQKNFAKGIKEEKGHKVIHFKQAFHGRSGYTLSVTNTLKDKIRYFPKFNWPRVTNPAIVFPIEEHLDDIIARENQSVQEIKDAFANNPDDIAAILIEPIQCEGGDNHFRKEFFQQLRQLADENEALLVFDEVQTGIGLTGTWWNLEQTGVLPDLVSFGKKAQVCGFFAGPKIDEVETNVFNVSSRINSTWGGNLVDMVRSMHYIRIIEEENLVENAKVVGEYLLAKLQEIQAEFPNVLYNARGAGLLASFSFKNVEDRQKFLDGMFERGVLILPAGTDSVRFRPSLTISKEEVDIAVDRIRETLKAI